MPCAISVATTASAVVICSGIFLAVLPGIRMCRSPQRCREQGDRICVFPSPRRGEGGERSEPGEGRSEFRFWLREPSPRPFPKGGEGAQAPCTTCDRCCREGAILDKPRGPCTFRTPAAAPLCPGFGPLSRLQEGPPCTVTA